MTYNRFVLDTTVLEDYFIYKNPNVTAWINEVVSTYSDKIIILPTIIIELIRKSHYHRKDNPDIIRKLLNVIKRIPAVEIIPQNLDSVKKLISNLSLLPKDSSLELDPGEFSLLQESKYGNIVIVSSDRRALKAYTFNSRMDPQSSPLRVFSSGEDFTET